MPSKAKLKRKIERLTKRVDQLTKEQSALMHILRKVDSVNIPWCKDCDKAYDFDCSNAQHRYGFRTLSEASLTLT